MNEFGFIYWGCNGYPIPNSLYFVNYMRAYKNNNCHLKNTVGQISTFVNQMVCNWKLNRSPVVKLKLNCSFRSLARFQLVWASNELIICHKLLFFNPISLQPNVTDLKYLKLWFLLYQNLSLKYQILGLENLSLWQSLNLFSKISVSY